jgi:hypothetical protein
MGAMVGAVMLSAVCLMGWTGGESSGGQKDKTVNGAPKDEKQPGKYRGKRILWVDSYHERYEWSDQLYHQTF